MSARRAVVPMLVGVAVLLGGAPVVAAPSPVVGPEPKKGAGLVTGGVAFTAVGLGGLGLFGYGAIQARRANAIDASASLEDRRAQLDQGRLGNTLAFAGVATAVAALPVGIVLLAVGVDRRRRARGFAIAPVLHPRMTAVTVRIRF